METPSDPSYHPRMTARDTLRTIRDELAQLFLERSEVIDGALTALLSRHHVLLIGPPGIGEVDARRRALPAPGGRDLLPVAADQVHHPRGAVRRRQPERPRARRVPAGHHRQAAGGAHRLPRRGVQGQLVDPQRHPHPAQRAALPQRAHGRIGAADRALRRQQRAARRTTSCRRSTTASCCVSSSATSTRTSAS